MTPKLIKKTLFELADLAAEQTMPLFRNNTTVENKLTEGFDPVTLADKNAELAIREYLHVHFPQHGVIGEEHENTQINAEYCWVLDPIDGTRAFISGLPGWGTLIGLSKDGKPVAGMMAQPFTGEHYFTDSDKSYLSLEDSETELRTSKRELAEATLMSTDPHIIEEQSQHLFHALRQQARLTRYGYDCYAYAMLAAGNVDLVVETGLNAYDVSALIPIIKNAGGVVTNWQGGSASNGGQILAAANKTLHSQTIEILNQN